MSLPNDPAVGQETISIAHNYQQSTHFLKIWLLVKKGQVFHLWCSLSALSCSRSSEAVMPRLQSKDKEVNSVFTTGSLASTSGVALTTTVCLTNTLCIWFAADNDQAAHFLNFAWFFVLNCVAIFGHCNLLSRDPTTLFLARGLCLTGYALLAYLPLLSPLGRLPPIAASMGASGVFQTLRGLTMFFPADDGEFEGWPRWRFYYYYIGLGWHDLRTASVSRPASRLRSEAQAIVLDFAKAVGVAACCTGVVMLCGAPHARDIVAPDATLASGTLFVLHVLSRGCLVGATFKCGFHCFDSIVRLYLLLVLGIECEGLFGKVREPKGLASWKTAAFPRILSSGNTLVQEFWGYREHHQFPCSKQLGSTTHLHTHLFFAYFRPDWNRPINRILRDLVFLPSMPYLGKLGAVFLTFFISGATHLCTFLLAVCGAFEAPSNSNNHKQTRSSPRAWLVLG